jgi:hypothetical protein
MHVVISFKQEPGIHGKVEVKAGGALDAGDQFHVELLAAHALRVQDRLQDGASRVVLRSPVERVLGLQAERPGAAGAISAFDVSPGGGLLVYGTDRGGRIDVFEMGQRVKRVYCLYLLYKYVHHHKHLMISIHKMITIHKMISI